MDPEKLQEPALQVPAVTSPLIPWNSCGAYMSATLGIAAMACLPFCFFNLVNVLVSFIYAIVGFQIERVEPEEEVREMPEEADFQGVGGHRMGPSEHEAVVTGG